ncbi:hypothetical protein CVD28_04735 [Bacillus sp. M6-12]|uniref:hypothetical protein n=1 Tax=Bacillus sp. M6-12 TaxID=2054166 RepID=UPI000C77CF0E|nr:hypothetical protein [Bacillus sp. M6-12]PLS19722.1 hypothetical protein CVD28_04735 [Bacillus sp. M6-12]
MVKEIPFKEIGKVGKKLLVMVAGVCQNYKEEMIVEEIDFDSCPTDCPLFRFDVEKKRNVCMENCLHNRQMKTPKVVYMNERHKYNIKKELVVEDNRLSKYQLLQLVSYHFLGVDSRGVVPFVSAKQLAEKFDCTVKTIKNNNKRFVELGLISITHYSSDLFSVDIQGYEDYHLTKMEGGTGYVQMSKNFLEALVTLDNVNSMRLAIRALLQYDNEVELKQKEQCYYSYNDIKRFMPSNINHKKIIDELLLKTKHIFDFEATDKGLFISLKDEFNGKVQKQQKEEEFKSTITGHMIDVNRGLFMAGEESVELLDSDTEDLSHLSMEYGVDLVIEALDIYIDFQRNQSTPEKINNVGGFIRTVIRNNFIKGIFQNVA